MNSFEWREYLDQLVGEAVLEIDQAEDSKAREKIAYAYLNREDGSIGKHLRALEPIYITKMVDAAVEEVRKSLRKWGVEA